METGCPQPVGKKASCHYGTRACRLQLLPARGRAGSSYSSKSKSTRKSKRKVLPCLPIPGEDQDETAHETKAADDRTDGHRMFLVLVDLDRTQLRDVFFRGVTDVPAVSERDDPHRDQDDPEDSCGLHVEGRARENAGLRPGSRSGR